MFRKAYLLLEEVKYLSLINYKWTALPRRTLLKICFQSNSVQFKEKNNHIKRRLKNKNSWDSHYISNIKSIMSNGEIMICWRVFLPWSESHLLLLRYLSHISLTNLIVRIWCVRIQLAWCEYNSWKLFRPSDHHCDNCVSCDISAIQKLALCILERFQ